MLITSLLILFGAAGMAYFFHNQHDKYAQIPDLAKVSKTVKRFGQRVPLLPTWSEEELEKQLAKYLQIHFRQVRRQFPIGDLSQRERIDLDIANGAFGIELKLTHLLHKTNERNRLFGQIDTYQARRYGKQRLLVVIVGERDWQQTPIAIELKQIIVGKGAGFVFLPTT